MGGGCAIELAGRDWAMQNIATDNDCHIKKKKKTQSVHTLMHTKYLSRVEINQHADPIRVPFTHYV